MKKTAFVIAALLAFGQLHAGIRIAYNNFEVDNATVFMRLYSDSIYGARGDGLRMGGAVSTLDFGQSFTSYNPACLAFQKTAFASFSGIPIEFLGTPISDFLNITDMPLVFENTVTDFIDGYIQADSPGVYSNIDTSSVYAAQANGLTGMEGILPFAGGNASIAAAREEKLGFELSMLAEGIRSSMDISDPANPGFAMSMSITAGFAADVNLKSIVTSVGIGRKISPYWGIGAVVEYVDTRLSVDASGGAQAIGSVGPMSYEFNTSPANSLDQYLRGELKAAAWALRVGTSLHAPEDNAEVAVDFSIQPKFVFGGRMIGMAHTLPTDSTVIAGMFLAGMPMTVEDPWDSDDFDISMKLPSYFRLTLAWKPGMVMALNYVYNFDEFSFSMDSPTESMSYDMHMQHIFRLGFNFEFFQIGGGIILSHENTRMENKVEASGTNTYTETVIPVASLGWVIPLGTNMRTEVLLAAFPLPAAKFSLTVNY